MWKRIPPRCSCPGCWCCAEWLSVGAGCLQPRARSESQLEPWNMRCFECAALRDAQEVARRPGGMSASEKRPSNSAAGGMSRKRARIEPWCGCSCERPEDRIPLDLDPSIPTVQCRCTWCGKADEFGRRRCGVEGFLFGTFCQECREGCNASKQRVAGQAGTNAGSRTSSTSSIGTTTR